MSQQLRKTARLASANAQIHAGAPHFAASLAALARAGLLHGDAHALAEAHLAASKDAMGLSAQALLLELHAARRYDCPTAYQKAVAMQQVSARARARPPPPCAPRSRGGLPSTAGRRARPWGGGGRGSCESSVYSPAQPLRPPPSPPPAPHPSVRRRRSAWCRRCTRRRTWITRGCCCASRAASRA